MTLVRYGEYRRLEALRRDANNAMMALLAGSKLAVNTLQLTAGSTLVLSQIFPKVPHIERFNLQADLAASLLDDAEHHLATMAVPYVLALHEDFMMHCANLLAQCGLLSSAQITKLSPKTVHEKVAKRAHGAFTSESLELFHLVRTLRNSQIHEGGRVSQECSSVRTSLTPAAVKLWEYLTKAAAPPYAVGDSVALRQPQMVAALAITHKLMEEANVMLQPVIPAATWARMAVEDAITEGISLTGNPQQRFRKIAGFARQHYGVLALPEAELRQAATAVGLDV
jgi:hypothetical protein